MATKNTPATWLTASLVALGLAGCGDDGTGGDAIVASSARLEGQDCLVILLDALHATHLGCYGGKRGVSPAIDRLAGMGARFERATSQASWTLPSTVSLFTGAYQQTHGVTFGVGFENIQLADEAFTLAERFADSGYATACFTQNPFAGREWGLDQGFDVFEEVRSDGTDMTKPILEHMREDDERARFTYVHFRRPHTPYDPAEKWADGFVDPAYAGPVTGTDEDIRDHNSGRRRMTPADVNQQRALYEGNIRQVDDAVARLLAGIDLSKTLVIVLSDHGEAFGQHDGRMGHNWRSFEEYIHIPLIVAHPSAPGPTVVDTPVMTIDVVPTLVELFGLSGDALTDQGRSFATELFDEAAVAEPRLVFTASRVDGGGRNQFAAFDGRWKYIQTVPAGAEQLFDLLADPDETRDLASDHPDDVARLRDAVSTWRAEQQPVLVTARDGDLDPESIERLRALGYLPEGK